MKIAPKVGPTAPVAQVAAPALHVGEDCVDPRQKEGEEHALDRQHDRAAHHVAGGARDEHVERDVELDHGQTNNCLLSCAWLTAVPRAAMKWSFWSFMLGGKRARSRGWVAKSRS